MYVDPLTRISRHFILADFLGNTSVYRRGFPNMMETGPALAKKSANLTALCQHGLEPILEGFGPLSISYGYISPGLSEKIVTYQDPNKPSHHRFDLGAAADICVHGWVQGLYITEWHTDRHPTAANSPIALAHEIDQAQIPYSRLITYSESPYLCLAISDIEIALGKPRKAFYENRYTGKAKIKPEYTQLPSSTARHRHFERLRTQGLAHEWEGAGYPTYHGGGTQQYQHMRVSKYTMVSDWLFDLQSIANGAKNVPSLNIDAVQDSFAAAGIVYDQLIEACRVKRFSIVRGYVSHLNPSSTDDNDWRDPSGLEFELLPPEGVEISKCIDAGSEIPGISLHEHHSRLLVVIEDTDEVLTSYTQ